MKLLTRTNLYYIFFSLITYVIVAGGFYLAVEYVIYRDVEERLAVERKDFEHFISTHAAWNEDYSFVEGKVFVTKVSDTLASFPAFKDTLLDNRYSDQLVPFREHSFYASVGPNLYKVSIRKSMIESNRLLKAITITMLILLSGGMGLLFLFQRRISKSIWQPFYDTLSVAKAFDVTEGKNLQLDESVIYEFNELNAVLNKMTDKISKDYRNLKEFTEDASHEIQTPLALINSRVEELMQEKSAHPHMGRIQDIHESVMRLSKLNQALLLLSKIENGQFHSHEPINLALIVRQKIKEFEDVIKLKEINLQVNEQTNFVVDINSALADILVTNLIGNAVKHNITNGSINIVMDQDYLLVRNTGLPLNVAPEKLFERFKKQNQSSTSLGLGLAIVKRICNVCDLIPEYTHQSKTHNIRISRKL